MKKLLLLTAVVLIGFGAQAQNRMWLGGTLGFGSSTVKDNDATTGYQVGPQFGFMLNENMAVGLNMIMNGVTNKANNADNDVFKTSGQNFEPFFRYYFAGTGNFKFFGDARVGFGGGKTLHTNDVDPDDESTFSNFSIMVVPGAQYWFNDNWSMAATLGGIGYRSTTNNKGGNNESTTNEFAIGVDFDTFNLGFFFHFGG